VSQHTAAPGAAIAADDARLSVASLPELLSAEGVSLQAVDDPVVAVIATPPRPRFLTAPETDRRQLPTFEGGEHTYLGNNATIYFDGQSGLASKFPLTMPNGLLLTYGQVVALGGDFYGLPDAPISDDPSPPARFNQAFATLAQAPGAATEAPRILAVMQIEIDAVNQAIKDGKLPSSAYAALGDTLSGEWNRITGGGSIISDFYPLGRYLQLAATNWDHFGQHAVTCYTVGHGVAMAAAVAAANGPDQPTRTRLLQLAYATNAFADHFLTDLFSSGHMRTPRKEMYDEVTPSAIGSLLSRFMHDEDSAYGLVVTNARGQTWHDYGDKRLRDPANAQGLAIAESAVQASVDEVWAAYQTKAIPTSHVLDYVANLAQVSVPTDRTNPSPLFVAQNGTVERRTDPSNRFDYTWTSNWYGWSTLALLEALPEFEEMGDNPIPAELATDILQFWNNSGSLGVIQYGILDDGSYGAKWHTDNIGEGSGAVAFIPVDSDGDGKTEVVQCWNNGGSLGMILYQSNANGIGYRVASQNDNMGEGAGAIAWLPVDVDGDGRTEVVQLWDNGGSLGMVLYVPNQAGTSYSVAWQNDNVGEGSGAVAFIPVDANGDGKTEIVQCWNNGGSLGMIEYAPIANGAGYHVAWQNDDMGEGQGAVAWIPVDVDGDGSTDIVQCWSNGGALGMIVYSPDANGPGYKVAWQNDNMGEGAGAIGWHTADVNGDGRTEILQLWNNNGQLGMVSYTPLSTGSGYGVAWQSPDVGQGSGAVAWLDLITGSGGNTSLAQLWNNGGDLGVIIYQPALGGNWSTAGAVPDLKEGAGAVFFTPAGSVPTPIPPN
jgi:hypothetical protein